jgi:glycosyltransferase involved in cell wall biosynthesis
MRVLVTGLRGFPGVQGGIETHAQELYPRLEQLGCDVEVATRSSFVDGDVECWHGVKFRRFWSPRTMGVEAFLHTLLVVLYAGISRPDILHIHAIGPSFFAPLARLFGLKVVVTHHGADYQRDKWGPIARTVLRSGELLGMRFAHGRIAVSRPIARELRLRLRHRVQFIPNGVVVKDVEASSASLPALGLEPGRYVLNVGRLVPEKRQLELIKAFRAANLPGWKLALVGSGQGRTSYTRRLKASAGEDGQIVLAGFRSGRELAELYSHAGLFVLPSTHEGLPIALLEALSFGLRAIASDIDANREVRLPDAQYFPVRDTAALTLALEKFASQPLSQTERADIREHVRLRYDWKRIAQQTLRVYESVVDRGARPASDHSEAQHSTD